MVWSTNKPPTQETEEGIALAIWVEDEFDRFQTEILENMQAVDLRPSYNASLRPREGMIVYADGTKWNPGNGAGLYLYNAAGVWVFLAGSATVLGYRAGEGGTVTQATSKSTAVVLNKATGLISMHAASLAADTTVSFVFTNSLLAATDQLVVTHDSVGAFGSYLVNGRATGAGAGSIAVRNITTGALAEAIALRFSIIKSVNA